MKNLIRKVSPTVIAVAFTALLVAGIFLSLGWQHTNSEVRKDQRSWCTLLRDIQVPPNSEQQPTGPYGVRINDAVKEQYKKFGCHVS